ncbi:MAG TPA: DUF2304 domain-containing protein [Usitatibacter sp.]|nr:DUF2304 domain-containing protein [Usitatibacter sp.]
MRDYHLTVLVIGIGLAAGILYLVRRDHIYIRQGMFWITVAVVTLAFAFWPTLIDLVGGALGIAYPPTLLLLAAIIVLVLKALYADIALTKANRDIRRLNQRMALLEAEHPADERAAIPAVQAANEHPVELGPEKARRTGL